MGKGSLLLSTLIAVGAGYLLGFFGEEAQKMLSRVSRWCIWGAWGMILLAAILYRGFGAERAAAWSGVVGVSSLGLGASLTLAAPSCLRRPRPPSLAQLTIRRASHFGGGLQEVGSFGQLRTKPALGGKGHVRSARYGAYQ